jgi:LuxR family quorum sensing-dependent transcriptional regulator
MSGDSHAELGVNSDGSVKEASEHCATFAAANFAALRLEHLGRPDEGRIGSWARLTSRELAVRRLVSTGRQTEDIAKALGLGEETIRSHLKKAEVKLGVHNRTHAACEALRQNPIP